MKVIPFGYSTQNARETLDKLMQQDPRAILVDIRYSTASKNKPQWSRWLLERQYGFRYLWIKDLGNENYYSHGPIKIHNAPNGLERLKRGLKRGYTIILLCTCANYEKCHRKVVVEMLKEKLPDMEVIHSGLQSKRSYRRREH